MNIPHSIFSSKKFSLKHLTRTVMLCVLLIGYALMQSPLAQAQSSAPNIIPILSLLLFDDDTSETCELAEIVVGHSHSCARLSDGSIKCWGWNAFGQLGNNSTPVPSHRYSLPVSPPPPPRRLQRGMNTVVRI